MKLIEKMVATKYAVKIAKLVEEAKKTNSSLIYLKANTLKSEAAKDCFNGRLSVSAYRELFKIEKADAKHHFLDFWIEEINR